MTKVAIVFHSGYGHTAKQAEAVRNGVARTKASPILIPVEEADNHWDDLKSADAIIFGSPTYMGSVSGEFKAFADKSSKVWFEQGWKDKIAAGFTNSSSLNGDKHSTLQQLSLLAAQHGMHWVSLGLMPGNNSSTGSNEDLNRLGASLGAMAQSNADQGPEHGPIPSDLETAAHLGERVATIATQFAAAKKVAA